MAQNLSLTLAKAIKKTTSAQEGRHSWLTGVFQLLGSGTLEGMVDIGSAAAWGLVNSSLIHMLCERNWMDLVPAFVKVPVESSDQSQWPKE